jgi:hypothetical protein
MRGLDPKKYFRIFTNHNQYKQVKIVVQQFILKFQEYLFLIFLVLRVGAEHGLLIF